jgi:hypothetical protein
MAGSGAAFTRAGAALTVAANAAAQAKTLRRTAIYAADYGVKADGVTDDTAALNAAISAVANGSSAQWWFTEVVLPAGDIRITGPIICGNGQTSLKFRIRGAGLDSTRIYADFYTTNAAPQFTVTGGGGSGCVLYPIWYFDGTGKYKLSRVFIANGGTGYTSAPTATLVAATGSGASVTLSVSGGAVTGVTINAAGSGYPNNYDGDALVVIGSHVEISDLSVVSSPARAAASNGGISAYPYFTTNNGIRYEPMDPGYIVTCTNNRLSKVWVSGQPGHGVNAARPENWRVDQVFSTYNGADGMFVHTDGFFTSGAGISNTFRQYRATGNYARGLTVFQMAQSTYKDCCIFNNLQGGGAVGYGVVSGGAITSVTMANSGMGIAGGTSASLAGIGGGTGAVITPTISNGAVSGFVVSNGGSGYTTNPASGSAASTIVVTVPSVNGLPAGVNEEVWFYFCQNQYWYCDVELNTAGAIGRDVMRLTSSPVCKIGGYLRGGRYGVYLQTARAASIDSVLHYGNVTDASLLGIFTDTGSNQPKYAPLIGTYYPGANVISTFYTSNAFAANGFINGVLYFNGMIGSNYAASASSTYTPDAYNNGCDQYVTLTGNVTINDSAGHISGQRLRLILIQDATGGRSVTFAAAYVGANTGTLTGGAANKIGIMDFQCVIAGSRTIWVETAWSGWL